VTRERWLAAFAVLGLGILCLALAYDAFGRSRPAAGVEPTYFETSSIDLSSGTGNATLSATGMAPGDAVGAAITVSNSGARPMVYGMRLSLASAAGVALAAALDLTIKTIGSSCDDFDGTTLYDGRLAEAAFGSPVNGRPLPAATAEILCFRATLPVATGNAQQGTSTAVTLMFSAGWPAAGR
jgi:hypothetical protein